MFQPADDSYWAEIVRVPTTSDEVPREKRLYGVRKLHAAEDDIVFVERHLLRHRKLRTMAFIHISNDKTHDSHAAQTFLNKTFEYLQKKSMLTQACTLPRQT